MYIHNSATSPDCHLRIREDNRGMETGESGADEANRTVNTHGLRGQFRPTTTSISQVKES